MIRSTSAGALAAGAPGRWRCARCRPGSAGCRARRRCARSSVAGADQALLVGERQHPAVPREPQPGRQARRADDRRHRPVDRLRRRRAAAPPAPPPPRCRCRRAPPRARPAGRRRRSPRPAPAAAAPARRAARCCPRRSAPRPRRPRAPPCAVEQRDRVPADRAGRAEDADPPPHRQLRARRGRARRRSRRTRRRPSPRRAGPSPRRGPGISRLASLTPNRRLTADSSRSPNCEQTAMPRLRTPMRSGCQPTARPRRARRRAPAAASPPSAPDQVLPGLTAGQSFAAADARGRRSRRRRRPPPPPPPARGSGSTPSGSRLRKTSSAPIASVM